MRERLIFYQLFDSGSSTYTYLLADSDSLEGVLIDPVAENAERDLQLAGELGLKLLYALDTHLHADHVTAAGLIGQRTGAAVGISAAAGVSTADLQLVDGAVLPFGRFELQALATPGHTASCMSFFLPGSPSVPGAVFTGDALLIRGNGRTDFQDGDAAVLYRSIHEKIYALRDDTLVYPAHDYQGIPHSTVGLEKRLNRRIAAAVPLQQFTRTMAELKLPEPKKISIALPANRKSGLP